MNRFDHRGLPPHLSNYWGLDDPTGLAGMVKSMWTMPAFDVLGSPFSDPLNINGSMIYDQVGDRYSSMMGADSLSEHLNSMIGTPAISAGFKAAMGNIFDPLRMEGFKPSRMFPEIENVGADLFRNLAIPTVGADSAWRGISESILPLARVNMAARLEELSPSILGDTSSLINTAGVYGARSLQDFIGFVQASPEAQEIAERADEDPELRRELEELARTANFTGFITSPTAQGTVVLIAIVLIVIVGFAPGHIATPVSRIIEEGEKKITAAQRKKHQQLIDGDDDDLEDDE